MYKDQGTCPADALAKAFDPDTLPVESGMCYLRDHHHDKLPAYLSACITGIAKMTDLTEQTLRTTWRTIAVHWIDEEEEATPPRPDAFEWLAKADGYSDGIEALRLSNSLAGMRGRPRPGLEETLESIQSVFCQGDPLPLDFLKPKLLIGQKIGELPAGLPALPLQQDIDAAQMDDAEVARQLGFALSPGMAAPAAAAWLEGFLQGGGALLVYHRALPAVRAVARLFELLKS